jgi:hypothetical protein
LQAKKLRNVQAAFKLFNSMMRRPGKGDVTFLELQVQLQKLHHLLLMLSPNHFDKDDQPYNDGLT